MFKVFNTVTEQKEVVAKIDYKIHYHISGKPFEETEETTEEVAPKRGRPKAN